MEYNKTLNLPKTKFPMKANLSKKELEILNFWEEKDIYKEVQEKTAGSDKFVLHDGPPYANGHIHLGTTLNKILKDIIVKYKSMNGFDSPFVPGWDTHGLPIEQQAIKNLGLNRSVMNTVEFRNKCKEYALKYVDIQREEFKRLGVRGDWNYPYLTLDPKYEAAQISVFGEMAKKGYIYKGMKPVFWCADCGTALAEAEVEYLDKKSSSIYVKFKIKDAQGKFEEEDSYVIIWTTTPWTLPANLAITLHPNYKYLLVRTNKGNLLIAEDLLEEVMEKINISEYEIIHTFKGKELEGLVSENPLIKRDSMVIIGEHVTLAQGTGCVHTAPGHGLEDYEIGKKYDLPIISPLDDNGRFTEEGEQFTGMDTDEANNAIVIDLENKNLLLNYEFIEHQYPHCWRCKKPILFRATEQWFASIDGFRNNALDEIKKVRWIPSWGMERIYNMVAERGDWCISRQRTWGVPIPIFYCSSCKEPVITDETITGVKNLVSQYGSNIWYEKSAEELLPENFICKKCGTNIFYKEEDIMDVWFDSGSSHEAVCALHPDLKWPADMYLEGSDQHRGWFNSSLSTAVAVRGKAPYKIVLTHGYVVDEQGRKMSKSLGNVVSPLDVVQEMGADILRLWVSSADYKRDVAASPNILKQMTESYRKIRNTIRYLLANLYDFDVEKDRVSINQMKEVDRLALSKLNNLIKKVTKAYDNYEFHIVYHTIYNFCIVDMSTFYLDISKDRLYVLEPEALSRKSVQTVMYDILYSMIKMLSPILAFTAEESWQYMPNYNDLFSSVQLEDWPKTREDYIDTELEEKWRKIFAVREHIAKALEEKRQEGVIGHALDARVDIYPSKEVKDLLSPLEDDLKTIFIVSDVRLHEYDKNIGEEDLIYAEITHAEGDKCERCWMYCTSVGMNDDKLKICARCVNILTKIGY